MVNNIAILQTIPGHLREISGRLRLEDRNEVEALGFPTTSALWRSYKGSVLRNTALIDNEVAAVWGVGGPPMGSLGQPWLLTSDVVKKISPLRFCRIYQEQVYKMLNIFPKLVNYVDSRYTSAIRLLDIIGFKIDDPQPFGANDMLFCKFEMVKH